MQYVPAFQIVRKKCAAYLSSTYVLWTVFSANVLRHGIIMFIKEIKIGKMFFCCRQPTFELTADPVCMGRKSGLPVQRYIPVMTFCPWDQLLVGWSEAVFTIEFAK